MGTYSENLQKFETVVTTREQQRKEAIELIKEAAKGWPDLIPRKNLKDETGIDYSPGYLANCDSNGTGITGAFRIGRQVIYPKKLEPTGGLVDWLIEKVEV